MKTAPAWENPSVRQCPEFKLELATHVIRQYIAALRNSPGIDPLLAALARERIAETWRIRRSFWDELNGPRC